MKKLPCKNPKCGDRRVHHEQPDEPRGTQYIEVPDQVDEGDPVFCSFECAMYDGWMTARYETPEETKERRTRWYAIDEARRNKR